MVVLIGVALVVIGFALRLNPMLVVTVSGIVTALLGGLNPVAILDTFGTGFASNRSVTTSTRPVATAPCSTCKTKMDPQP